MVAMTEKEMRDYSSRENDLRCEGKILGFVGVLRSYEWLKIFVTSEG
jgi:hypothetical protein